MLPGHADGCRLPGCLGDHGHLFSDYDLVYGDGGTLTNEDTGEVRSLSGSALASEGLSLVLDEAKTSAVWHILPE